MSIYRIPDKASRAQNEPGLQGDDETGKKGKSYEAYVETAIRLIPADVVAAYVAIRSIWLPGPSETPGTDGKGLDDLVLHWGLPVGGLIAVILLRILGTSKNFASFKDIQWSVLIVSSIAYVAWIFSFNDPILGIAEPQPKLSATFLVLTTIIGPGIVARFRKDAPA